MSGDGVPPDPDWAGQGIKFTCLRCGACCQDLPRIPVFPDEADRLVEIAKARNIELHLVEDLVFPDVKNRQILVITYRIMFDNPDKVCPFFVKGESSCSVHPDRPLSCRAYPLAIKTEDAFHQKIEIGSFCTYTQKYREKLEGITAEEVEAVFGPLVGDARRLLNRNNEIRAKIRFLSERGEIEIPPEISGADFDEALKEWPREEVRV
ncbi:MAG: YkgJ family cysteine cluster protein [Promethearchaeota archaeon]